MGFVQSIGSFYKRYFDFQTRSSRSEYWWVVLYLILLVIVCGGGIGALSGGAEPSDLVMGIGGLAYLAHIIPIIAVAVRRFHDQDKSGWFYLLSFIPLVGGIIMIVFMCIGGTPGPNRFGPDPLGRGLSGPEDVFS